ncbi:MAG: dihydrolipoyl dehydrogenase [Candidatus Aminicenantes bacterium RBG_13_59_9]|nr:MAG: dihydrolipoyl dehydrogenase [Candidatus Aminicenantes bacterium RBG_13_59_9]
MTESRELIVIGGGPGGYTAALRAAQLKMKTTLIERERLGGTCMNYGCIPTKFLLHETQLYREMKEHRRFEGVSDRFRLNWTKVQAERSAVIDRLVKGVEFLLHRNGVEVIKGQASMKDEKLIAVETPAGTRILAADKLILAAGSRSADLPFLKPDGRRILTNIEALELAEVPKSLSIIGAGAIGLEIGLIYARLGSKVTILEILPHILPGSDRQMALRLDRILKKQGLEILTDMRIEESEVEPDGVRLKGTCLRSRVAFEVESEKVLLAVGRRPNSEIFRGVGRLSLAKPGYVEVNAKLQTAVPGVFAIGDLIGGKLLAHKASHDGILAAENLAGASHEPSDLALPMAVFTDPEFASVGLTEEEARERGVKVTSGMFSLQANGRALTMEKPEGMVKVLADEQGVIVGAHILAPAASEMIPELTLAVRKRLRLDDVSSTIHIHPTLSEALMEAALKAQGRAIQALND